MGGEIKKEYRLLDGRPVFLHSLITFLITAPPDEIVITVPPGDHETVKSLLETHFPSRPDELDQPGQPGRPAHPSHMDQPARLRPFLEKIQLVEGGSTRQDSVRFGLEAFTAAHDIVLIHDGARPWISPEVIRRVIETTRLHGASIPVAPSTNAMKQISPDGTIEAHLSRAATVGAQTPQAFRYTEIVEAHRHAAEDGIEYVDDSEIYHRYIGPVHTVQGDLANIKITFPSDLPALRNTGHENPTTDQKGPDPDPGKSAPDYQKLKSNPNKKGALPMRIGFGWDLHTLVKGRPLLLGGIKIDAPFGESGHSDGDVLIHAVIDALFGAAGLGDIGTHFPPSDPQWKNADSTRLLDQAVSLVHEKSYHLVNLDSTVVLQQPKLAPYIPDIAARLAELLLTSPDNISVKAKTKEHVDAVGEGRAIEAFATVLLEEPEPDIWT